MRLSLALSSTDDRLIRAVESGERGKNVMLVQIYCVPLDLSDLPGPAAARSEVGMSRLMIIPEDLQRASDHDCQVVG